jgi:hypothetical protein
MIDGGDEGTQFVSVFIRALNCWDGKSRSSADLLPYLAQHPVD